MPVQMSVGMDHGSTMTRFVTISHGSVLAHHLNHGGSQELVAQLEASPELLQHRAVWNVVVLFPHDGLMEFRVKDVSWPRHSLNSQCPEGLYHLLVHPLHTPHNTLSSSVNVLHLLSVCTGPA